MNCIIIDDEPLAIRLLEGHIAKFPALKLTGKCAHAIEAFDMLRQQQVDVMFR